MRYRHCYSASFRIRLVIISQYQLFIPFFQLCAVLNSSNSQVGGRRAQNVPDLFGVHRAFYSSMDLRAVGLLTAHLNSTPVLPGLQFIRTFVSDSVNGRCHSATRNTRDIKLPRNVEMTRPGIVLVREGAPINTIQEQLILGFANCFENEGFSYSSGA